MKNSLIFSLSTVAILFSCSSSGTEQQEANSIMNNETSQSFNEWKIPVEDVFDGGPGRDGIPALVDPALTNADNASILKDTDLVIGYKNGLEVRAYQHIILDWHEIVNDQIGGVSVAITYCPLTGTGIGWNRVIDGEVTTFGVSGLLYNTNLIPFDRASNSNWSQILNEAVNGPKIGKKAELIPLIEMDWLSWKTMFPDTKILSLNTGFSRTYGVYPYVDYKTNNDFFLFPVPKDNRLPLKERVLALLNGDEAKAYRFLNFGAGKTFKDTFKGSEYLLVGNSNFMTAFELKSGQDQLEFSYIFSDSEGVFTDTEGNLWNIFGEAIAGPREGQQLEAATSFMGYWFSIPAFYETVIFNE